MSYKLPDGKIIQDVDEYIRVWSRCAEQLGKMFGAKCLAFDPGFTFLNPNGGAPLEFPTWAYNNLAKYLELK